MADNSRESEFTVAGIRRPRREFFGYTPISLIVAAFAAFLMILEVQGMPPWAQSEPFSSSVCGCLSGFLDRAAAEIMPAGKWIVTAIGSVVSASVVYATLWPDFRTYEVLKTEFHQLADANDWPTLNGELLKLKNSERFPGLFRLYMGRLSVYVQQPTGFDAEALLSQIPSDSELYEEAQWVRYWNYVERRRTEQYREQLIVSMEASGALKTPYFILRLVELGMPYSEIASLY